MKKTLIVLATLSAIAGAAQAQSNVTLYGVADIGFVSKNNGDITKNSIDSGKLNGSRFGFKGTEDLGGGMAAIFTLESGFNADTGAQSDAASFFNRQSFVGLTGGFGTVKLGRQMNPVYANSSTFDPFANALSGDSARLFNYQGSRTNNMVTYAYETSGFRGEVQYGMGESGTTYKSAGRTVAGLVGYKQGPVDVVLTHQNVNDATEKSSKVTLLGGNYDFGMVKAFAAVSWEKGYFTPNVDRDQRDVLIGLKAPVGAAGAVIVSYVNKTNSSVDNADADQWAIGYTHNLSKRTALYTSYGQLSNDGNASYQVTTAGNSDKLFMAGVRHSF